MKPAHWAGKVRATRSYRRTCFVIARQQKPANWTPRAVVIDVEYRCSRKALGYVAHDIQNAIAALKAGIDGAFQDAGIVPNDSAKWLTWGMVSLVTLKHPRGDGVTIIVRAA